MLDLTYFRKINVYKLIRGAFSSKQAIKVEIRPINKVKLGHPDASDVIVHTKTLTAVFKNLHSREHFQKPPFSKTYTSVFDRISVDGRQKRIKKYAFSNENALVWTGPEMVMVTVI